jgi:hypothetical protein
MVLLSTAIAKRMLISRAEIQAFVDHLAERFHPSKVVLFGSYAYGKPSPDSDVDLLVIAPHRGPAPKLAARMLLTCPHLFPLDLLVRSPQEIGRRTALGDRFLHEVMSKGIVLHETNDARMGR